MYFCGVLLPFSFCFSLRDRENMTDSLLLLHLSCYFKILNHLNQIGLTRTVEFCAITHRLIRTAQEWYISSWMCHFFSDIPFPFPCSFSSFSPLPKNHHFCTKTWNRLLFGKYFVHLQDLWGFELISFLVKYVMMIHSFWIPFHFFANIGTFFSPTPAFIWFLHHFQTPF